MVTRAQHLSTVAFILVTFINTQLTAGKTLRRDIVFLSNPNNDAAPTQAVHPTISMPLFENYDVYPGGFQQYNIQMSDEHQVYNQLVEPNADKANDTQQTTQVSGTSNSQQNELADQANTTAQAQTQIPASAIGQTVTPETSAAQQNTQSVAPNAAPAQSPGPQSYSPVPAPAQPITQQEQAPAAQTATVQQTTQPAAQTPAQTLAQQTVAQTQNTQAAPQASNTQTSPQNSAAQPATQENAQADQAKLNDDCYPNCPKFECKPPCVKVDAKEFKKPPKVKFPFLVLCDDIYPQCGFVYNACNETWFQTNCPKRCGICKPNDKADTKTLQPNAVKEMLEEDNLESELVAPEQGDHPLKAKYSIKVKPLLKNGVPQTQEIRILKPGSTKPLILLKQNITKPMIENIEIDVPKKGSKYSDKPKVEVIEGENKETLTVQKGQVATLDQPAAKKPEANPAEQVQQDQTVKQVQPAQQAQQIQPGQQALKDHSPKPAQQVQPAQQAEQDKPAQQTQQVQPAQQTQPSQQNYSYQPQASSTSAQATTSQTAAGYQAKNENKTPAETSASQTPAATQSYYATTDQNNAYAAQTSAQTQAQTSSASSRSDVATCEDNRLCASYTPEICHEAWLQKHCRRMCKLCTSS